MTNTSNVTSSNYFFLDVLIVRLWSLLLCGLSSLWGQQGQHVEISKLS